MFAQVIKARAKDAAAVKAAGENWQAEQKGKAEGFLGVTSGVADDGTAITIVRFESEAAAQKNSERPEQSQWWETVMSPLLENVEFFNCPTVDLFAGGGDDSAGFVQVMQYKPSDVEELRTLAKSFENVASERPDILGGVMSIATDGTVFDANYFRSEAEAREAEGKPMSAEMQQTMQRFGELAGNVEFIDLRDPVMH